MSQVSVSSVQVLDNPAPFTAPLRFEICYESLAALEDDLEWRLVYVGSAEDEKCDQILESVFVGPIVPGTFRFVLEADAPQVDKIPKSDLLGATVVLLSCFYKDQEFVRVGYYVSNEVPGQEPQEQEGQAEGDTQVPQASPVPPSEPAKIIRNICAEEPRVTKFPIRWDTPEGKDKVIGAEGQAPQSEESSKPESELTASGSLGETCQQEQPNSTLVH